jgi:hypothetical protein
MISRRRVRYVMIAAEPLGAVPQHARLVASEDLSWRLLLQKTMTRNEPDGASGPFPQPLLQRQVGLGQVVGICLLLASIWLREGAGVHDNSTRLPSPSHRMPAVVSSAAEPTRRD